ncbi:MAG: hypothetical protein K940chlam1_00600 [Candidatus Anoxychlamydiales bacterium]|nr:hypothetical protein [Candidatus Anoxychlamydiales bacterium]NGX35525.1 hypothetical protein [Candidatus Anoxychlamydiales bacterium]
MNIYSLIPCLYDLTGHHFSYHLAFGEALKKNKWTHLKIIPKTCQIVDLPRDWKRALILHEGSKNKNLWNNFIKPFLNFFPFLKLFWKIKKKNQLKNVFFLEYFTLAHLFALYLAVFFTRPKCCLWLLYRTDLDQIIFKGKIHKILHKLLIKILGKKNLTFFTDSELLSFQLEKFFEAIFFILPIPHTKICSAKKLEKAKKDIICWWPGGSIREEKGLKAIIDISKQISSKRNISLMVAKAAKAFLFQSGNIEYVNTDLKSEEYNSLLFKSDIILLPYLSEVYRYRTSGIFVEAIVAQKIVLTTSNTWMAHELKKFNLEELIINWDDLRVLDRCIEIYNSESIKNKLHKMSGHYRSYHSVENYAGVLKEVIKHF